MNAVNVGLVTFIIQHNRIQGVFLLCKITNLLIYSIIKKRRNMNVLLRQCKNKKRKSHICAVRVADMGLFGKDN